MQFRVLGSLDIRRDEATVAIGSRRLRTLLAALLVDAGKVVSVDALVDALWGDRPPAEPRNAIQTYVARLRERLGPDAPLVTRSPGYLLDVEPEQVDAVRFEQLLTEAHQRRSDPTVVRRLLDEALGLWRGPAYAEFADHVARAEALRLDERRLVALEERAAALLELGEAAALVGELEALATEHPLRERFVELLMRALAAVDRQAESLAVYRAYRERLADETGLEPSPTLRDLEGLVLRGGVGAPPRKVAAPPAPASAGTDEPAAAIPVAPTTLIGREQEINHARAALDGHPVVTLTGTGGVGKTRVAAEVANEIVRRDRVEAAWVDLASVGDPAAVEHVLVTALHVDLAGGRPPREALLATLTERRVTLVLDNCEHLVTTVAPLLDEVQRHCPHVRVLATSRERLAIDGERVLPIAPLPVEAPGAEDVAAAVRLFCQRATAAGVELSPDLPVVTEICRHLDGLPLALELAAARIGALSPKDLLASLLDGAPAAVGRRRSGPERHRDLSAVVEWSYRLLDEPERHLFERLSVFAGAFGIDEAHAICAPDGQPRRVTVEQLVTLAERSLLTGPVAHGPGAGRYRMLLPLRTYARRRLAEHGASDTLARRHAAVLVAGAERAAGPPLTEEGRQWLEASLDDLREASRRARMTGDGNLLGRLVAGLYSFDYWRPGAELIGWADDALAVDGIEAEPTAPEVHAAGAVAAWMRGDLERARRLAARGAELGRDPDDPARIHAFEALGDVANFDGRLEDAQAAFREQVRLARLGQDPDGEALGLANLALVLAYAGRVTEAISTADAARRSAAAAGPMAAAFARYVQGECRADTDPERAVDLVEEAAAYAHDHNAWFTEGVARLTAASLRGRHGDPTDALPAYGDLLLRWRRSGNWIQQWTTLRNLAELLVRLEADEPAVAIMTAAEVEESAPPTFGPESDRLTTALDTARERLPRERFQHAREQGRSLPRHHVVDLALAAIEKRGAAGGSP